MRCIYEYINNQHPLPMTYFTLEEVTPRSSTLQIILQIAHSYRVARTGNDTIGYSLN